MIPGLAVRRSGGIQGGLSNGEDIVARIAFKPTSTIARKQNTVSRAGEEVELIARGRHDPCVVPRAVPMVEAMAALVLADQLLQVCTPASISGLSSKDSPCDTVSCCHHSGTSDATQS